VWQFAADGTEIAKRHFPPWAPMQVATLAGGRAMAVARKFPTCALFPNPNKTSALPIFLVRQSRPVEEDAMS